MQNLLSGLTQTKAAKQISKSSALLKTLLFLCTWLLIGQSGAQVGTWTAMPTLAPHANNGVMLLLSDGTVVCHTTDGGTLGDGTVFDRLTPDSTGSYLHGTWSSINPMITERYSFSSNLLRNGNLYCAGGEYGTDGTQAGYHGETYDPLHNTWTAISGATSANIISDGNCILLDDDQILQALVNVPFPTKCVYYTPSTQAYSAAPSALHGDNESMWLKLPDNSILFVTEDGTSSERYIPSTGTWIADGTVPVSLYDPYGYECGPAWMLPNGEAFFIGGTNKTAIYHPSGTTTAGTWRAGPDVPNSYGMPDAPGAMMVNGHILFACSPQPTGTGNNEFHTPTVFYEYNYLDSTFTSVASPTSGTNNICQQYNLLTLPDGNVLLGIDQLSTAASEQYYIYTPGSPAIAAGRPVISTVTALTCDSFMITGKGFNGLTAGSAFGDENQNDNNYPLVRFYNGGKVYYGRTSWWNSTGVQRNVNGSSKLDTAYFTLPATLPAGASYIAVVAVGNASDSILFNNAPASLSSPLTNSVCSGSLFTYTPTSTTNGATFTWTRPAVTGISNAAITTPQSTNPSETLINTTSLPVVVTYVYTVTGAGCSNIVDVNVTVNPAPVISFTSSPATTCALPDTVTFTNTTTAGSTYIWYFGDGGTSTATNPTHIYTSSGSFTVKVVASGCGTDSLSVTNAVDVTSPAAPTATSPVNINCGSTASLTATGITGDSIQWYSASTGGTLLANGSPYVTPALGATTTYYVQNKTVTPQDSCEPYTYNFGTGGNYANDNYRSNVFNVLQNCTLVSVLVDADGAGDRTITLMDSGEVNTLQSLTVNIPNGVSYVTLNFPLTVGNNYELGCGDGSTITNLYRNETGAAFPYNDPDGFISITGNNVPDLVHYYFFYDWHLKGSSCVSARTPVTVDVKPDSLTTAPTATTCGLNNGSVSVTLVGGGTPTYTWSNSLGSTATVSNVASGTYTVTVSNGVCSATASETVAASTGVSLTPSSIAASCGQSNGSVSVTVANPVNPTYSWSPGGATTATVTGLASGTYTVTVHNNGCSATASAVVAASTGAVLTHSSTATTCGLNNGSVTVTVANPNNPTYTWSNGLGTTATVNNVPSGIYTVTVNNNGCSAVATDTVAASSALTLTHSSTATTCGLSNGSVSVTVSNPSNPTYTWSGGLGTTASISGTVPSGIYTVTVDNNGCTAVATDTVAASTGVSLTPSSTATTCGQSNGTVSVTVANPSSPTYSWSPGGATTATVSNLASGTYTVTVHNSGCSATATASVAASTGLTLTHSSTATSCGLSNGSVSVTVSNPVNPTYTWSGSLGTTASITGTVPSGIYTVTVTSNGCSAVATDTVAASTGVSLTPSSTATTCGLSNGTVSVTVANPSGPTYSWSPGGATTATVSNLASGTYTVTVHNSGCSATATASVAASAAPSLTPSSSPTTCGHNNGSVSVTVANPSNPTYTWSGGLGTTASISGTVPSGSYTVTVTNGGCTATATVSVAASTGVSLQTSSTPTSCSGSTGTATVTITNPVNPTYSWSGGGGTAATASNLGVGTYTVTVNSNGCSATASASVSSVGGPTITASSTATTCGGSNGTGTVHVTSGTGPFTYLWNNSGASTDSTATGLASGTYSVTVTAAGCASIATVTVGASTGPSLTPSSTATTCGQNNGTVSVSVANPSNPSYSWSGGLGTAATESNVPSGTYTVTVTNAGCTATTTVSVAASSGPSLTPSSTATSCGQNNGTVSVSVANPSNPSYSWSGGLGSAATESNVPSGSYTVTVTNGGCTATTTVSVAASTALSLQTSSTATTCGGGSNGTASVSFSGTSVNTTYLWSPGGGTTATISGLAAGQYSVTVHNDGCSATATVSVASGSGGLTLYNDAITDPLCFGQANGSVTVSATGGSQGYTYSWSTTPTQTDSTASGLSAGRYVVTVSDGAGCQSIDTVTISQPSVLTATIAVTQPTQGNVRGTAVVTPAGGTSPYSESWSNGDAGDSVTLVPGTYTVTVTDAHGCDQVDTVVINKPNGISSISESIGFTIAPNPAKTEVVISLQGSYADATISLQDMLGQVLITQAVTAPEMTFDLGPYTTGVYFVELTQGGRKAVKKLIIVKN